MLNDAYVVAEMVQNSTIKYIGQHQQLIKWLNNLVQHQQKNAININIAVRHQQVNALDFRKTFSRGTLNFQHWLHSVWLRLLILFGCQINLELIVS